MTTHERDEQQILADVAVVLSEMQGCDLSESVAPETRFFADLGMASIDAVVLGERIQAHYSKPIPFDQLIAELGRREDRDLTLGELVSFVRRHLNQRDGQ